MPRADSFELTATIVQGSGGEENEDQQDQGDHDDDQGDATDDYEEEGQDEDDSEAIAARIGHDAAWLRSLGVNWLEHPEYASHRLIVLPDPHEHHHHQQQQEQEQWQQYYIVAHFVMAESLVFRDTIMYQDQDQDQDEHDGVDNDNDDNDDDDGEAPLPCLRIVPASQAARIRFIPLPSPRPLPDPPRGMTLPPWLQAAAASPEQLPLFKLNLPCPDHFDALLKVMHDGDLNAWEAGFRHETIGPITQNVARLVCPALTKRCLEYYHRIKNDMAEELQTNESMETLKRLYDRAIQSGLLSAEV
ncbi:hypothetical protein BGX31_007936 [Mortierella sp. GBA43]|nr:hypothetical protein BGX31_007936 [Mortierella sp. GBA43]